MLGKHSDLPLRIGFLVSWVGSLVRPRPRGTEGWGGGGGCFSRAVMGPPPWPSSCPCPCLRPSSGPAPPPSPSPTPDPALTPDPRRPSLLGPAGPSLCAVGQGPVLSSRRPGPLWAQGELRDWKMLGRVVGPRRSHGKTFLSLPALLRSTEGHWGDPNTRDMCVPTCPFRETWPCWPEPPAGQSPLL